MEPRRTPNPKYDLAPMVREETYSECVFLVQLERFFDDYEDKKSDDDSNQHDGESAESASGQPG